MDALNSTIDRLNIAGQATVAGEGASYLGVYQNKETGNYYMTFSNIGTVIIYGPQAEALNQTDLTEAIWGLYNHIKKNFPNNPAIGEKL